MVSIALHGLAGGASAQMQSAEASHRCQILQEQPRFRMLFVILSKPSRNFPPHRYPQLSLLTLHPLEQDASVRDCRLCVHDGRPVRGITLMVSIPLLHTRSQSIVLQCVRAMLFAEPENLTRANEEKLNPSTLSLAEGCEGLTVEFFRPTWGGDT